MKKKNKENWAHLRQHETFRIETNLSIGNGRAEGLVIARSSAYYLVKFNDQAMNFNHTLAIKTSDCRRVGAVEVKNG